MSSFNRVIVLGNLTRDVELRYTPSGMAIAKLGLALNDRRKDAAGQWVDETTFVDVTLFGRSAEVAGEYLSKGSQALVEGRLKLDTWEDKTTGQKRSKLVVVGDRLQLLGGRERAGQGDNRQDPAPAAESGPPPSLEAQSAAPSEFGDDIPF